MGFGPSFTLCTFRVVFGAKHNRVPTSIHLFILQSIESSLGLEELFKILQNLLYIFCIIKLGFVGIDSYPPFSLAIGYRASILIWRKRHSLGTASFDGDELLAEMTYKPAEATLCTAAHRATQ